MCLVQSAVSRDWKITKEQSICIFQIIDGFVPSQTATDVIGYILDVA